MKNHLIQSGTVYDGSRSTPLVADVRVRDGMIDEIGAGLSARDEKLIDATGLIVAPGLIDLHAHVFSGVGIYSVDPDEAGLRHGVTTLLDTGTAGALTFDNFRRHVMPKYQEEIYALLNISMIGCIQGHLEVAPPIGDLHTREHINPQAAIECIKTHRDKLIGVKVRLTSWLANHNEANERAGLEGALAVSDQTGLPLMVHHAMSQIPTAEVLDALQAGDIYTHLYHPHPDNIFEEDGKPTDAAQRARERGVIFDVGHGMGAFAWRVAEPACREYSFWPDTISTDIHRFNINGPVFDMPTTMSKFLYLGMPLEQVIHASTHAPAKAMRLEESHGLLEVGRQADIALLRLTPGRWELMDVEKHAHNYDKKLVAAGVFKAGEYFRY